MNKTKLKQKFLHKIEFYYRNFGSEWSIEEFLKNEKHKDLLLDYLYILFSKGIVSIDDNHKSFKIIELPSDHNDLL